MLFDRTIQLSKHRYLAWNNEEIWLSEPSRAPGANQAKPISYFSMPNDAFLEFRNNLSVEELEDPQFMQIFAKKQPIKGVAKINSSKFAVLFDASIVIVEVGVNEMLVIQQEISFKNCLPSLEQYVKITDFMGYYDSLGLYLKDAVNQRLYILKYSEPAYSIQFL